MRPFYLLIALAPTLALTGCHDRLIDTTLSNRTSTTLRLIEFDYPSASFGIESLAPGHAFHYRLKVIDSGPTTVLWTDAANHNRKSTGPTLHEHDDGVLTVTFNPNGPAWALHLAPK